MANHNRRIEKLEDAQEADHREIEAMKKQMEERDIAYLKGRVGKPLTDRREQIRTVLKSAMNVTPYKSGALTDKKILDVFTDNLLDIVGRS